MQLGTRKLDHLVYCVPDLDEAIKDFKDNYGLQINLGGKHTHQGTMNAILKIGNACYLELLAIDLDNPNFKSARWMGIDLIETPRLTRWCLATDNIEADASTLKRINSNMGELIIGERKTPTGHLLQWQMSKPLAHPLIEPLPFLIDWSKSDTHPVANLKQLCTLESLEIQFDSNDALNGIINQWDMTNIYTPNAESKLVAKFKGPNGHFELS